MACFRGYQGHAYGSSSGLAEHVVDDVMARAMAWSGLVKGVDKPWFELVSDGVVSQ